MSEMSKNKTIVSKLDHKELLKNVQTALESNLSFLKKGLTEKKWARNLKKAGKILVEDYKQLEEAPAVVAKKAEKKVEKKTVAKKSTPVEKNSKKKSKVETPKTVSDKL